MITSISQSKLTSIIASTFRVIYVSEETSFEDCNNMITLLPSKSSMLKHRDGQISCKALVKEYKQALAEKNTMMEYAIYVIGSAIKAKENICIVCSDSEYEIGYTKVLAKYISSIYGIEYLAGKDLKERINNTLDDVCESKKDRKLLKMENDELSDKKIKLKKELTKSIRKSLRSEMDESGDMKWEKLNKRYAIDQLTAVIINNGIGKFKNGTFKNVDVNKIDKIGPYIKALIESIDPENSDKLVRKCVNEVAKRHQLKLKEKSLKQLGKDAIIMLIGDIYTELQRKRFGDVDNDEDE